jgi:hypothetical protein
MTKKENSNSQVTLVLDLTFGEKLIEVGQVMPVWIIDSSENRPVVEQLRKNAHDLSQSITLFAAKKDEPIETACDRIVQSLDEHHNDFSQTPGYSWLRVIGVSLEEVNLKSFLDLNFDHFCLTSNGFLAKKIGISL